MGCAVLGGEAVGRSWIVLCGKALDPALRGSQAMGSPVPILQGCLTGLLGLTGPSDKLLPY